MVVTIFNLKGQLVGNFLKSDKIINENSSETLRKNLKILSVHHPKYQKPSTDKDFGYYLAGLIEGKGYFNELNELIIGFNKKDISLAYFLKSYLNSGQIKKIKNTTNIFYIVSKKEGIFKILNLINGKIRTDSS